MATLEDIKKQLQSDRKVNEAISRGTHDTLRTNKKILAEILEHFKGIKAAAAVEAAERKEQKREDVTAGSRPGGSSRFSGFLPKGVKDGLGSLMGFVKKGLLIAAIPAILAFINSDYWPKFRDTMMDLAKKIKMVYDKYLVPFGEYLKGAFLKTWELIDKWWPTIKTALTDAYENYLKPIGNFFTDVFVSGLDAIKVLLYGNRGGPRGSYGPRGLVGMFQEFKDGNIFEGLKIGFGALYNFFSTILQGTVNKVYDLLASYFDWEKRDGDISIIGELIGFFEGMAKSVKDSFTGVMKKVGNYLDQLFSLETLESIFTQTFPLFKNPFTQMIKNRDQAAIVNRGEDRGPVMDPSGEFGGIIDREDFRRVLNRLEPFLNDRKLAEANREEVEYLTDDMEKILDALGVSGGTIQERIDRVLGSQGRNFGAGNITSEEVMENIRKNSLIGKIEDILVPFFSGLKDRDPNKDFNETFGKNLLPGPYGPETEEMRFLRLSYQDLLRNRDSMKDVVNPPQSNTQINNIGDQNAYLINGASGTHDTSDPKLLYGTNQF